MNSLQGSFVAQANNVAELLQLTHQSDGSLDGSLQTAFLVPSGLSVSTMTYTVTGTSSGGSITLHAGLITVVGTVGADGITLNVPQADGSIVPLLFAPSPVASYTLVVTALQLRAATASASAAAASAAASAAAANAAAASAAASSSAAQQLAMREASNCAAIGGHIAAPNDNFAGTGNCVSNIKGDPSGQPGADCQNTEIGFNSDGTIDRGQYSTAKDFYPGCSR